MTNKAIPIKILIVGEPKTGKTSFLDRYANHRFVGIPNCPSDFAQKIIILDNMNFAINLWDIGKI